MPGPTPPPLLDVIDAMVVDLTEASRLLAQASRWAGRDRDTFSPLGLLGGPVKYWKWHQAKRRMTQVARRITELRGRKAEASELPDADVAFSKLDMVNDLLDALPFNLRRVGSKGGPTPIWQQLGVETNVYNQIETARVGVDNLLDEVGRLRTRLTARA